MIRSTSSLVTGWPSARVTSLCSHCQTWDREISAVAASSIRLKIATAPVPASQLARYCRPTLTLLRSPASVMPPGVLAMDSRSAALTSTSSRCLAELVGPVAEHAVEHLLADRHQVGMGDPGPVEAVGRLAGLVLADLGQRLGVDLRVAPARDERRHAAHRVRAAAVTRLDQQLGVGPHERRGHRHRVALGQDEVAAPGAELLDDAEQVVPAARVQARRCARAARRGSPPSRTPPGSSRSAPSPGSCPRGMPSRSWARLKASFQSRASRWLSILAR